MPTERWTVPVGAAGTRLDRHVADQLDAPRNQVQRWIRQGLVTLDGEPAKPSLVLRGAERVTCHISEPLPSERALPEAGELSVLYEDGSFVVLDKPAGLAVHPGAGQPSGTLVNRLLYRYPEIIAAGSPERPGIVHRLDRGTTGLLVVARTAAAYRALAQAFAERRVHKDYVALVYGTPSPASGEVSAPIGRHRRLRTRMAVRGDGRPALTRYRTLGSARGLALLLLELHTGRTHQIRVHLASLQHPLVGDTTYGEGRWHSAAPDERARLRAFPRPALHALRLRLEHPETGRPLELHSPLPADLVELWTGVTGGELPALLAAQNSVASSR